MDEHTEATDGVYPLFLSLSLSLPSFLLNKVSSHGFQQWRGRVLEGWDCIILGGWQGLGGGCVSTLVVWWCGGVVMVGGGRWTAGSG